MPVMTLYRHGVTVGTPPGVNSHRRAIRGDCEGWTNSATRSNRNFLYSVDETNLTGIGFALSLTVKRCPLSPNEWASIRDLFIRRLKRVGLQRMHWLTEWQRRGVPHLHAAVWFSEASEATFSQKLITDHWLDLSSLYASSRSGQHVVLINNDVGWFKYLSKHAVRGLQHYQRSADSIPQAWQGKTGRMWGKIGDWPTVEPLRLDLKPRQYHRVRRLIRSWRKADARQFVQDQAKKIEFDLVLQLSYLRNDPQALQFFVSKAIRNFGYSKRIVTARTMLRCSDDKLSGCRGASEWVPADTQDRIVDWVSRSDGKSDPVSNIY